MALGHVAPTRPWGPSIFALFLPFFVFGVYWPLYMLSEDLIKLSRGVLGGVRSAARFFFGPRGPLWAVRGVPEGSRGRFGAFLKMLKKRWFLWSFWPWGELLAVQGGHWASCGLSRASSTGCLGTRSSYRRGSSGSLERSPVVSEGVLGGGQGEKVIFLMILGGSNSCIHILWALGTPSGGLGSVLRRSRA